MQKVWTVGQKVFATQTVYENPDKKNEIGPFPAGGYVHALTGEPGIVEHVYDDGTNPTVRFIRTDSETLVSDSEISENAP